MLVRDYVHILGDSVVSFYQSVRHGTQFLVTYQSQDSSQSAIGDKELFENDIESIQRAGHFQTPLTAIDTQNRIWLKIITREK